MAKESIISDKLIQSADPSPDSRGKPEEGEGLKKQTSKQWIGRIDNRIAWIKEKVKNGWDVSRKAYLGKILTDQSPSEISEEDILRQGAHVNLIKSYIDTLLPNLYFQWPQIYFNPRNEGFEIFSRTDQLLTNYCATECDFDSEFFSIGFDANLCGIGWAFYNFDTDRMVATIKHVPIEDVVVSDLGQWRMKDQSWVAIRHRIPIEQARIMFFDKDLMPNCFNSEKEANSVRGFQKLYRYAETVHAGERDDFFEYWQIWEKRGTERKILCVADGSEDFLKFKGFSIDKINSEDETPFVVGKEHDWPFFLDKEEFPLEDLRPIITTTSFYGENEVVSWVPFAKQLSLLWAGMCERTRKSFALKGIVDSSLSAEEVRQLADSSDLPFIRCDSLGGKSVRELVQILDIGGIQPHIYDHFQTGKGLFDELTGMNELLRGGLISGRKTAAEINIVQSQANIRISRRQKAMDDFVKRVAKKIRLINAQLVPPEQAFFAIGSQEDLIPVFIDQNKALPGMEGYDPSTTQWSARAQDIKRLLLETDITIDPETSRKYSQDEEVAKQTALYQQASNTTVINEVTGQPVPFLTPEKHVAWHRDIASKSKISNINKKLPNEEEMKMRMDNAGKIAQLQQQMQQMAQQLQAYEGQMQQVAQQMGAQQ